MPESAPATRVLRVLVVDDNKDAADTAAEMLSLLGHEVSIAYDGASAVEIWSANRQDAVILDLGMPVMNGYDAASKIREQSPSCLLIALSAWARPADVERGRRAGFDHHIAKPATIEELVTALERRLQGED